MPAKNKTTKKEGRPSQSRSKKIKSSSSPKGAGSTKPKKERPSGGKGLILKDSYETWLDAQVAKRSKGSSSNQSGPAHSSVMPSSTFSSWLSKQSVSVKEDKPPQRGPMGTYERWLQKRVEERRSLQEEEGDASGAEAEQVSTVTVEDEDMVAAST